ncbi:MAG: ABC transporter ATP-binding protein [Alphaproteobacteria bacterium]|nr:ABC transporter ATP-binding protein [Alphaproteobacteria bacterium]
MKPLIQIKSLSRRFGAFTAVNNISMTVNKGDVIGFIGPNGAGKTTTMRVITGFISPSEGDVSVCGYDVTEDAVKVKEKIGYMPESVPAYSEMSVYEMLSFIADVRGIKNKDKKVAIEDAVEKSSLSEKLHQPVSTLSKGYRRRLGFAQAIIHDPDVLILDEPTEGLDPNQKYELHELITGIAKDKAIIISTHILDEVDKLCNKIVVINKGEIVADETPQKLKQKAKEHNAVEMLFNGKTKKDVESFAVSVGSISDVVGVNVEKDGKDALITAYAKKGKSIEDDVLKALKKAKLSADKLSVLSGRIDSAFRALTK